MNARMCGITGWVDFEHDLNHERAVLAAMTATMACRGPDDEGMWTGAHVALGHRRLSVIDLEGGRQPMAAEDPGTSGAATPERGESSPGTPAAILTYSGEVYNFRELREELAAAGHRFRTRSDTEVVLHAYLEWGEDLAAHLNGMYAFAVWDTRAECLLLVRDRMGVKPLHYYPTPHGVLFGSEPKAILANPAARRVLDADGMRELLSFVKTPERAVFAGMYEVRPGSVVRIDRAGLRTRRYWQLEAWDHPDDLDTTVATVRELLDDIVTRQLISDVPLCTLLSGGLDSSVITALAAKGLAERGAGPVRSFAVDFAGQTERFEADLMRDTPDTPYVHELAKHVAADHSDIVLDTRDLMDADVRSAVLRANDAPNGMGDMFTSLYLLFAAIREHSTVALSGESADEVFGGYLWFHEPEAVHADTFPWLAMFGRAGGERLGVLDPGLTRALDLPGYQADSYRQAVAEVPRLPGEEGLERRMREVSYFHLTRFVQYLLDRKDRMSMASGLEVRVPFCDHRLVEYVFNAPWAMKTYDGREKSLLRAATVDLLPESISARRKSPYPSTQDPAYEQALREEFGRLLARPDAPVLPLIDRKQAGDILTESVGSVSSEFTRRAVELVLGLDRWLEEYEVELDLPG
ncbi:asparagine synthase (glutamine-hydrolysing) [Actinopolymorpha cephalotaxi]|uniref:asparagine synthase (glutamine-hydrolyzing) n=1 Tax=Actinopolymorpha cephalotaxi TaxID=504797 RepID=A0A1I2XEU9_9ACTN|nr:asparagine synthase (glutamine-hydrolyzing) [Actinopolymorpha cephalotaxi]NYH86223.1 asparagine synthase (glutamine-hydrolyzing) [Actinopolymorpha cephalotaxi]SFH12020.1 asparagine synthase (glutamine-hydrolysing) [Actinopolymorpha cephalotaxi]